MANRGPKRGLGFGAVRLSDQRAVRHQWRSIPRKCHLSAWQVTCNVTNGACPCHVTGVCALMPWLREAPRVFECFHFRKSEKGSLELLVFLFYRKQVPLCFCRLQAPAAFSPCGWPPPDPSSLWPAPPPLTAT